MKEKDTIGLSRPLFNGNKKILEWRKKLWKTTSSYFTWKQLFRYAKIFA